MWVAIKMKTILSTDAVGCTDSNFDHKGIPQHSL